MLPKIENPRPKPRVQAIETMSLTLYALIFSPNCFSNVFSFGAITNWQ